MQKHVQSLNRWDHVPVNAFRLTRESVPSDIATSPGWTSEPSNSAVPDSLSYDQGLRNMSLGTMLWQDKSSTKSTPRRPKTIVDIAISPVLLPVRDGDRTPPRPSRYDFNTNRRQQQDNKNRKESRREMKMSKRKGRNPTQRHYYHQKPHFRHNHHPNTKSRSTGSLQRNFHSSPTTIPTLSI